MKFRNRDELLRRIHDNVEKVRLSRKLATICCEVPILVTPEMRYRCGDRQVLDPLCEGTRLPPGPRRYSACPTYAFLTTLGRVPMRSLNQGKDLT